LTHLITFDNLISATSSGEQGRPTGPSNRTAARVYPLLRALSTINKESRGNPNEPYSLAYLSALRPIGSNGIAVAELILQNPRKVPVALLTETINSLMKANNALNNMRAYYKD
jgi:hypothetical protein